MATTTATQTTVEEEAMTIEMVPIRQNPYRPSNDRDETSLPVAEPSESLSPLPEYPTGAHFWGIVLSQAVILILGGLDNNIVATVVVSVSNEFQSLSDVGWYSTAFRLCCCAFQFMFSKCYKLFPLKTVLMLTVVIFLIGSVLCASAKNSATFIAGRAATGVGFAGILSGCYATLLEMLPLHKRPVFSGAMASVESVAIISAPIVGGLITQSVGWRWCFWINLPIGGVALLAIQIFFSNPRARPEDNLTLVEKIKQLDIVSNCFFIPSLSCLFVALSSAGTKYAWSDGRVIGLFVAFAVLLGVFGYNQYRLGDSAALPLRILKEKNVIAGFIFCTCTNSMMNVLEYYLPTFYQIVRSYTPGESGVAMIPILFGMLLGLLLQGFLTSYCGYYAPCMIVASILMPISAGLMTTFGLDTSLAQMIIYSGLAGFAGGIGFQGPQSAVQTTLGPKDVNLGTGVILFGQNLGPAIAVAVGQVIFTNSLVSHLQAIVPGLAPSSIENIGLSHIVAAASPSQKTEVLIGIGHSLNQTWYLAIGLACTTMVGSLLVDWKSVKTKQT